MPDITADGKTRVYWVTTIANIQAPTTTELNAGIALQSFITADGLIGFKPDTADVDTSALDSTFNTVVNGRTSFSGTMLRLKKQSGTDTPFATLVRDAQGYVAIRRSLATSTAFASAQAIEIYPSLCGEVARVDVEPNSLERYEIPIKINGTPALRAAIA